jgi:hypothetical protein
MEGFKMKRIEDEQYKAKQQAIFDYFAENHNIILTHTDIDDIENLFNNLNGGENEKNSKIISKEQWEKCPNCDDTGAYLEHCCNGDPKKCETHCPELVQCEFCLTNPNSIFNQKKLYNGGENERI